MVLDMIDRDPTPAATPAPRTKFKTTEAANSSSRISEKIAHPPPPRRGGGGGGIIGIKAGGGRIPGGGAPNPIGGAEKPGGGTDMPGGGGGGANAPRGSIGPWPGGSCAVMALPSY